MKYHLQVYIIITLYLIIYYIIYVPYKLNYIVNPYCLQKGVDVLIGILYVNNKLYIYYI